MPRFQKPFDNRSRGLKILKPPLWQRGYRIPQVSGANAAKRRGTPTRLQPRVLYRKRGAERAKAQVLPRCGASGGACQVVRVLPIACITALLLCGQTPTETTNPLVLPLPRRRSRAESGTMTCSDLAKPRASLYNKPCVTSRGRTARFSKASRTRRSSANLTRRGTYL